MSCHLGYVLRRLVGLWGLFHFHILFLAEESLTSVCRAYFLSQPGIHSTMESLKRIPFFSTGEYLNPGAYFCSGWSMLRQYHPGCQRCIFMHVADHDVHLCRTAHVIHYRMRNLPSSLLSSLSSLLIRLFTFFFSSIPSFLLSAPIRHFNWGVSPDAGHMHRFCGARGPPTPMTTFIPNSRDSILRYCTNGAL